MRAIALSVIALWTVAGQTALVQQIDRFKNLPSPYTTMTLSRTPATGTEPLLFRNGALMDTAALGGPADYWITGNKITMSAASGGASPNDTFKVVYWYRPNTGTVLTINSTFVRH